MGVTALKGAAMEIRRRVGLPTSYLHVMNRGARRVAIFTGDEDRRLFVSLMGRFALKYEVAINAWCLMPNHYHMETHGAGDALWPMMRDLDGTYARAYNERHETTGCLFQGPFKSMAIIDNEGLVYVNRYIHANAIQIGYRPQDYPWSSCRSYLGLAPVPSWLDLEPVLSRFEGKGPSTVLSYGEYLAAVPPRRRKDAPEGDESEGFLLEFLRHIEERCQERRLSAPAALKKVSSRTLVCWMAVRLYGIPARIVREFYGYGSEDIVHAGISRFLKGAAQDQEVTGWIGRISASVKVSATQKP